MNVKKLQKLVILEKIKYSKLLNISATLIQKLYKGYRARCYVKKFRIKIKLIIKLQSLIRRYLTRKRYIFLLKSFASSKIQKVFRGFAVRKRNKTKKSRFYRFTSAIVVIQRNYRLFRTKKKLKLLKQTLKSKKTGNVPSVSTLKK